MVSIGFSRANRVRVVPMGPTGRHVPVIAEITESCAFSALTPLVGRQEGHPACKNLRVGCLRGYLSGARCIFAYGLN